LATSNTVDEVVDEPGGDPPDSPVITDVGISAVAIHAFHRDTGRRAPGLTEKQAAVLRFITDHRTAHGYPPTLREIGKHFGLRSTNGVNDHLRALERKGFIVRGDMLSRGIRIVSPITGEALQIEAPDPVAFLKAENEALRTILGRVSRAIVRAPNLTAELVVILGDVRELLRTGAP
jgi:hypothetical protein